MKMVSNFVSPGHKMFDSSIRAFLPRSILVPLRQSDGVECSCSFRPGDTVREGQIIASPESGSEGSVIHSSVPGKMVSVSQCTLPDGTLGNAAEICTDGAFSYLGKKLSARDWNVLTSSDLIEEFKLKGIVNTFNKKTESLSLQIIERFSVTNRFVIVRMFDEDPSRYTDSFITEKFTSEVVTGAMIAAKAFCAKGIAFVVPKKPSFEIDAGVLKDIPFCVVNADTSKYPSGFINNLIRTVRKSSKNSASSDFSDVSHKCIFLDPETALSVYEAVVYGIPVVERYIHVTGSCLKSAGMFKVRIGSSLKSLVEQCGGFKVKPSKIVVNGMITGNSIGSVDIPVTKSMKSIEFIPAVELCDQVEKPCIRCGKCRAICPEGLTPDLLYKHIVENYNLQKDICAVSKLCSQCCLCNSVCPSRLSLAQTISLFKE